MRKRYWICNDKYYIGSRSYTEGIGETGYDSELFGKSLARGLLHPFAEIAPSISYVYHHIVYVKRDGVYEYLNKDLYNQFIESSIENVSSPAFQIVQEPGQWVVALPPSGNYLKAEVLDLNGRVVWRQPVTGHEDSVSIRTENFARGTYIVVLTAQSGRLASCKVAVE